MAKAYAFQTTRQGHSIQAPVEVMAKSHTLQIARGSAQPTIEFMAKDQVLKLARSPDPDSN
jgi:hypothetical protein